MPCCGGVTYHFDGCPGEKPYMKFYIGPRQINPGAVIRDFKGERWTFVRISRLPEPGKSGKVYVRAHTGQHFSAEWCQEFYPQVFKGEIR